MMIRKEYSSKPETLILVGTLHLDPKGFKKSLALFESYQPDLILVEISTYGCRFRRKYRRRLRKRLTLNLRKSAKSSGVSFSRARNHYEIRKVWRQLNLPFEYRAAVNYASGRKVEVALVDSSSFSRKWIACWTDLISASNLKTLLGLSPHPLSLRKHYQLAKTKIVGPTNSNSHPLSDREPADTSMWEERERYMAERIRKTIKTCNPARAIFIGGWWHLTEGGKIPTLRELLGLDASHCLLLENDSEF